PPCLSNEISKYDDADRLLTAVAIIPLSLVAVSPVQDRWPKTGGQSNSNLMCRHADVTGVTSPSGFLTDRTEPVVHLQLFTVCAAASGCRNLTKRAKEPSYRESEASVSPQRICRAHIS